MNAVVLAHALDDRSWGALAMAIIVGPLSNLALAVLSLLCMPLVRRAFATTVRRHVLISLGIPAAAIGFDLLAILSMDLHGC